MADEAVRRLHDRATRGLELSSEEQATLDAWYAAQDAAERAAIAGAPRSEELSALRAEVEKAISHLRGVTRQIEAQAIENERLRRENAVLQQELSASQTARQA